MRQLHIAVDFDGTVVVEQWPEIGPLKFGARWVLQWASRRGHKLVLWTCREGQLLLDAALFLGSQQLYFDTLNDNLPERIAMYGVNSRKVGADLMIDDRAGIVFWPMVFLRILWFEMRR